MSIAFVCLCVLSVVDSVLHVIAFAMLRPPGDAGLFVLGLVSVAVDTIPGQVDDSLMQLCRGLALHAFTQS